MNPEQSLQQLAINTIRFLAADGVQRAKSGHPGLPMGAAAIMYTVWTRHLRHNPGNPAWPDRDRFILSGGHGSMLLYTLLYLTGYEVSLSDLQQFRQWGSKTPGHPEYGLTPGVDMTTGPLGQGFASGVGMAIAETQLPEVFDHFTYAIVTDGDLMEGITAEAASLAGHLKLGKLIYLYDDNRISIEGSTDLAFTEDRGARFKAYGWQVLQVEDGNDVEAIDQAIWAARSDSRPSLIICRTQIGYGLPTRQGTAKAHGEPPGEEELSGAKQRLGWPVEPKFHVPEEVLAFFRQAQSRGSELEKAWREKFEAFAHAYPSKAEDIERRLQGRLPQGWKESLPEFPADSKGLATRAASGKVLNALALRIPEMSGGSADLAPSNNTWIENSPAYQADCRQGRNFHFGVREHAMGAIVNGMAVHGGMVPYGATFMVFSDYLRPALRVAALSEIPSLWVFTHDSIGVGEDGPTHQPVEHLLALRAIPNLMVFRPADANETREAWVASLENRKGPNVLALTRQPLPTLDRNFYSSAEGVKRGAYVLADLGTHTPQVILMASGSEVSLIVEAGQRLLEKGYSVRMVSFPCWELFEAQDQTYRESVLPSSIKARVAVEAGLSLGWDRYTGPSGISMGVNRFGVSAPAKVIFEKFGFSVDAVIQAALKQLEEN